MKKSIFTGSVLGLLVFSATTSAIALEPALHIKYTPSGKTCMCVMEGGDSSGNSLAGPDTNIDIEPFAVSGIGSHQFNFFSFSGSACSPDQAWCSCNSSTCKNLGSISYTVKNNGGNYAADLTSIYSSGIIVNPSQPEKNLTTISVSYQE